MTGAALVRTHLVERLQRTSGLRVVLVVAPAGFGKSTLVRQALDGNANDVLYRVAPETKTLLAFLRGLTAVLEGCVPGAHLSLAIAYERAAQSPAPALEMARWFVEHVRETALRIVLDDLENATGAGVAEFVRQSIDETPEHVRWLIATRDAAALPLATWLAHGVCALPLGEGDLRFTRAEIDALAATVAPAATADRVAAIAELTGGWPAATELALRFGVPERDAFATPAELYAALASRRFDALDEPQRSQLLQSSVGADSGAGYDALFRAFLLARLRERGAEFEREALVAAAEAAELRGDVRAALSYYQRAGVLAALSRILASFGLALMDGGFADVVEDAVAALDAGGFDGGPVIMALKAIRDASRVRFDSAEAWFQLAIAASAGNDDLRLRIVHRYALDLLRRGRVDCIGVLESEIASTPADHAYYPLLCATLATAYAVVDRPGDARTLIASAMENLRPNLVPALRTRAYHQAAYVALRCGDTATARRYAERVLDVAVPNGFYDLAARAHSILYEIAHAWEMRPDLALAHVESVAAYGLKSGDAQIRQWALLAAYYVEAERGNPAMMTTIERALNAADVLQTMGETNAALLPGQALRATWSGDFVQALRLMAHTAESQVSADRSALRWAEIALFAAAAGRTDEARAAVSAARSNLVGSETGGQRLQAVAYLLIALSLLDDPMTWITLRANVSADDVSRPGSAFVAIADALYGHWFEKRDHDRLLAALSALRATGFGGIAMLVEALPAMPRQNVASA